MASALVIASAKRIAAAAANMARPGDLVLASSKTLRMTQTNHFSTLHAEAEEHGGPSFTLSEEQNALKETARTFAAGVDAVACFAVLGMILRMQWERSCFRPGDGASDRAPG
eukprot:2843251-Pleurochrysis_carterae.AAC.3